jgi:hypothetical protein
MLWAGKVTELSFASQQWYIILAGADVGMMLGQSYTDAVNRASRLSYGEATGITQTVRNYAASLGLAILGTILVSQMRSKTTESLLAQGVPRSQASHEASVIAQSLQGRGGGNVVNAIPQFIRLDYAYATRTVLYVMAAIMAVGAIVALVGLRRGVQADDATGEEEPALDASA